MGTDRGDDRYRGPDRRASSVSHGSHDGSLLRSALLLAGLAGMQLLLARFIGAAHHPNDA